MSEKRNEAVGNIKIADDVVATIAGIAAKEVEGVSGMCAAQAMDFFAKKSPAKGIRVTLSGNTAAVELCIQVQYGYKLPDVAFEVQQNVKKAIETMTGLSVTGVDVRVDSVAFSKEEPVSELPEEETEEDGSNE